MSKEIKTQVAILGSGPAGYAAAFRCADLGLDAVKITSEISELIQSGNSQYFFDCFFPFAVKEIISPGII